MEEEVLGKAYDARLMRRLLGYMRPYRRWWRVSLVFLLVQSAAAGARSAADAHRGGPLPAAQSRPRSRRSSTAYLPADAWSGLARIGLLYLGVLAGNFVCEFVQMYVMQYTGQLAMFDLRRQLMEHLQRLDLAFYDRNPVGRLVTRVTTDVDVLNDLFASGLVTILGDVLVLLFILAIMFSFSPLLTPIMLAAMPFVILVTMHLPPQRDAELPAHPRGHRQDQLLPAGAHHRDRGAAALQSRSAQPPQEFEQVNREHMDAYKDAITAYGWFYPVVEFISMLALAGILTYGGFRIQRGHAHAGRGGGVPAIRPALLPPDSGPEREVQHPAIRHGLRPSASSSCWIRQPTVLAPAAPAARARRRSRRIEFDHVWFAYKDEDWVLRDVSFTIAPGETIAVVGHTGAGKTTLISLLLRFYDVQKGSIRIGGVDMREFDPLELRRHFGVVLQDPYLFTGTLEDNIRLGTETHPSRGGGGGGRAGEPAGFHPHPAGGLRPADPRARQRPLHRAEAVDQLRARAGAQSALPDSGRGHLERRYRDRVPRARGAQPHGGRPHLDRDRAPALHHPARRPHSGDAQRQAARERHAPGTAGAARHLLEAVSAAVQGSGSPTASTRSGASRACVPRSGLDYGRVAGADASDG